MKKTEWFYDHNKKKWWMVTVATNAKNIPKIRLGEEELSKREPVSVRGINLYSQNKKLLAIILALTGCLGVCLGIAVWLAIS